MELHDRYGVNDGRGPHLRRIRHVRIRGRALRGQRSVGGTQAPAPACESTSSRFPGRRSIRERPPRRTPNERGVSIPESAASACAYLVT